MPKEPLYNVRREAVMTRLFEAEVELVFDAWTDPAQVGKWWGSRAFTNVVYEWEARPGGCIHLGMIAPCGTEFGVKGSFHEVAEPERLQFTSLSFEDDNGHAQLEILNTAIFTLDQQKTRLTLQAVVIRSTPEVYDTLDGIETGWKQSLDKLEDHLAGVIATGNHFDLL